MDKEVKIFRAPTLSGISEAVVSAADYQRLRDDFNLLCEELKPLHTYARSVDPAGQWGKNIIRWAIKRLEEGDEVRHLRIVRY